MPLFEPIFIDFVKSDSFGELIDKISSRNFFDLRANSFIERI